MQVFYSRMHEPRLTVAQEARHRYLRDLIEQIIIRVSAIRTASTRIMQASSNVSIPLSVGIRR